MDYKGRIKNVEVLSENNYAINKQIKNIFEETPKWIPGRVRGPKMNFRFAVPIVFNIENFDSQ